MLYSYKGQYPINLPDRIRLSDGTTRTDNTTFTEDELTDAGYTPVADPPTIPEGYVLNWSDGGWAPNAVLPDEITVEEKTFIEWSKVRQLRKLLIEGFDWRIQRYNSEVRMGIPPTDDIQKIDTYMQQLRDVTNQSDPFNIVWPEFEVF